MNKVIVGSKNPVKIETARIGFERMFKDMEFEVIGVSADSDVPDQPMGEDETLTGAINRVQNAKKSNVNADYWVGMEGGLKDVNGKLEAFAWIMVLDKDGKTGKGRTGSFFLPDKVAEYVHQGMELAEADDLVFKRENSKHTNGAVGILTGDVITRVSYYVEALILALIPFKNPDLY